MKLYVGVDMHKSQFTCCFRFENGKVFRERFPNTELGRARFLLLLKKLREQGNEEIQCAVEATGNARFFKYLVEREGFTVKVVNTMRFKVVNESVNKTDNRDAQTIAEFLAKDMLPESAVCDEHTERIRRLINARNGLVETKVKLKNQIHAILLGIGFETKCGQMSSRKGRQKIIQSLGESSDAAIVSVLSDAIEQTEDSIKKIEEKLEELVSGDRTVEILTSIPGTGIITALTIRAHINDIKRFATSKKLAGYAGLAPWVRCSNETEHIGRITKRGPKELRTAFVQMGLGMMRVASERNNNIMRRYMILKKTKGSGKAIVATANKMTKLVWTLLTKDEKYDCRKLSLPSLIEKADSMRENAVMKSA